MDDGTLTNGDFRIVLDGMTEFSGRLEYRYEDAWGTVCDDYFDQNNNAAQVACRQLGLPWTGAYSYDAQGDDSQSTWLDNVSCTGGESSLLDCSRNSIGSEDCSHYEDIAISCEEGLESAEGMMTSRTELQCANGTAPVGDVEWVSCVFSGLAPTWTDLTVWEGVSDYASCVDATFAYYGPMDLDGSESVDNCEMSQKCYSDMLGAYQDQGGDVSTIVASGEYWGQEGVEAVTWDTECWDWFGGDATVTQNDVDEWCAFYGA